MTASNITTSKLAEMKRQRIPIVALTAYDAPTAKLLNDAGVDMILVGDSVANVKLGYENTIPLSLEEILHHVRAVKRGNSRAMLVADMPYLTYELDLAEALRNAGRLIKEGGAQAVKIEGGRDVAPVIKELLRVNIPVIGHLGLTPQALHKLGGYKVQGRLPEDAEKMITDAKILEGAGACAVVLECVPAELAKEITSKVSIPTIGIGAGPDCDGQILVSDDLWGMSGKPTPKFVKRYADLHTQMAEAVRAYADEVRESVFPGPDHIYTAVKRSRSPR